MAAPVDSVSDPFTSIIERDDGLDLPEVPLNVHTFPALAAEAPSPRQPAPPKGGDKKRNPKDPKKGKKPQRPKPHPPKKGGKTGPKPKPKPKKPVPKKPAPKKPVPKPKA
ncbi:hypothetical protein BGZ73_000881 [Actinomortierella ambigua]|nr:hypothetical protein BGZ73_000881 [Actinomortierella ambigua]